MKHRKKNKRTREFYESIVHDRDDLGLTYQAIANKHGVSRQMIEQSYCRILWRMQSPFYGLPPRAVSFLASLGIKSKAQAMKAAKRGDLRPALGTKNYGWKSYNAILAWLGLRAERHVSMSRCPKCGHFF